MSANDSQQGSAPEQAHAPADAVWLDRFNTPSVEALVAEVADESGALAAVRAVLVERLGAKESVEYRGLPWRWSIAARFAGPGGDESLAYLVPDPIGPVLCVALPAGVATELDNRKASRAFREPLAAGRLVGDRLWVEWPLNATSPTAELIAVLERLGGIGPEDEGDGATGGKTSKSAGG